VDGCQECGFFYEAFPVERIADTIRGCAVRYGREFAGSDDAHLRLRPAVEVWSALEYACHVRDVLLVQRDRAVVALVEDRPSFARMYREERVPLAHYDAHPPDLVVAQLSMAAELGAAVFDGLTAAQWMRPLIYNFPAPMDRDLAWLGRHTVHECEHHLRDVRAVILRTSR
jgi:hypothetical protein